MYIIDAQKRCNSWNVRKIFPSFGPGFRFRQSADTIDCMSERGLLGSIHIWRWPDGLLWRGALGCGARLRRARLKEFLRQFRPGADTSILDVGITDTTVGASNLLEREYPWPDSLTGCGVEGEPEICRRRGIRFVHADGCDLPFADRQFDIVHSNAVIEHVGNRERQRRFVAELSRVGQALWLVTWLKCLQ